MKLPNKKKLYIGALKIVKSKTEYTNDLIRIITLSYEIIIRTRNKKYIYI